MWGVGFPLVLGALIHRFSSNPKYSFVIVSYGYKSTIRYWEAWECMKKFCILLIITFLQFSPELAATVLLLFLCVALIVSAHSEPFISSLVNQAHLACDLLIFLVLLAGLLSTSVGQTWPGEVETVSIVVASYAACLFAGLVAILWLETGSKGGRRHTVWASFVQSSYGAVLVSAKRISKGASKRLLSLAGFSTAASVTPEPAISVMPEPAISPAEQKHLHDEYTTVLRKIRKDIGSLAAIAIRAGADEDAKSRLQLVLEMLPTEQCP
jgi:hypothetical protein